MILSLSRSGGSLQSVGMMYDYSTALISSTEVLSADMCNRVLHNPLTKVIIGSLLHPYRTISIGHRVQPLPNTSSTRLHIPPMVGLHIRQEDIILIGSTTHLQCLIGFPDKNLLGFRSQVV